MKVTNQAHLIAITPAGGILGTLLTGVYEYVANKVGDFDMTTQRIAQAWGVGISVILSGVASFIAYKVAGLTIGLRVSEKDEREGLDTTAHHL